MTAPATASISPLPVRRRNRTPILVGTLAGAALLLSGLRYLLHRGSESTDDAQIEGRVMAISARVSGQVLRVHVEDNQRVQAGDLLVELDPSDFEARVEAARADVAAARAATAGARAALALTEKSATAALTQARGGLTTASSSAHSARAAIAQAQADLAAAQSRAALAEANLKRARTLLQANVIPPADFDLKQTGRDAAIAEVERERARLVSAQAAQAGSAGGVESAQGRVSAAATAAEQIATARAALALADARGLQAEAALKLAELNLSYATVRAPRGGVISRRSVEAGQAVGPDRPLLAIVPVDDVWVVGNFKEDQLAGLRPGQHATVRLDTYGGREFDGHVDSIAGGTGARFALLPPDNATGNFVKVVQRVPVLIRFDGAPGVELRPGMSADVTVRTRD